LLWSLAYLAVRAVLGLMVSAARSGRSKDLEILVLRVGFVNSGGLVFMDESAEEIATP
jgi:hypothetical protein